MSSSKVLFIDNHNFRDFPVGGTLSFARQMMRVFGDRLALVGVSDNQTDVGRWTRFEEDGQTFDFFAYRHLPRVEIKGLLPQRVKDYVGLRRHIGLIQAPGWRDVFIQIQSGMLALTPSCWKTICFRFTGVSNIAEFSKYVWVRPFAGVYEKILFRALRNATVILATADCDAILELVARSRGYLPQDSVHFFPTRIDTTPFETTDRAAARAALGIDPATPVALYCGRISWPKGWDLVLAGFAEAVKSSPEALLLVVGDGEDSPALRRRVVELGIANRVRMEGRLAPSRLPAYFAATDVVAIGSYVEGWSNTMLEALAAGRVMVSTAVSGSGAMIRSGVNGFVITGRDPVDFGKALIRAWGLPDATAASRDLVKPYRLDKLKHDLENLWPVIAREQT